jgi:hypothetical protein
MPFNINTFKSQGLTYGGARPSLFNITLSVPAGIGINTVTVSKFSFVCRSSELPPSQVGTIEVPYFGRRIKLAGERTFTDWNVTVMNDEDFSVRSMFELWSDGINRLQSNVRDPALYNEAYKTALSINQYAKDGELIRQYTMYGAFPTNISAIALDWDNQNQIETFTVNFAYDYWLPTVESSSKSAGGINSYEADAVTDGPLGPN